tara:strand:+ start:221 stop:373 length:153 start_codon:yes stop_codon:yes gene_type:complete
MRSQYQGLEFEAQIDSSSFFIEVSEIFSLALFQLLKSNSLAYFGIIEHTH